MMIKKKLKITGMHCTSCAMNIDGELEDTDGVKEASTSYAKALTEVTFDTDKLTHEGIVSIIKKTGYTAQPLDE
jgi:Cu+-exporting ATPase